MARIMGISEEEVRQLVVANFMPAGAINYSNDLCVPNAQQGSAFWVPDPSSFYSIDH
eukprot:COSAG03_NODE_13920_length_484_cov_0.628571_1_plen_57_part_00